MRVHLLPEMKSQPTSALPRISEFPRRVVDPGCCRRIWTRDLSPDESELLRRTESNEEVRIQASLTSPLEVSTQLKVSQANLASA